MPDRDWTINVSLVALTTTFAHDEIRRFWRGKGAPLLEAAIAESPSLWIGTTEPSLPENDGLRGQVGRLIDVLMFRGSTPDWTIPLLNEGLEAELLDAFAPRAEDPERFVTVSQTDLVAFLSAHRGEGLVFTDALVNR